MDEIDFSRGGYSGGDDEEHFKYFTIPEMPYWWYFREVLRASDGKSKYWQYKDGNTLSDQDQMQLIAISLLNYAVHTSIAESLIFFDEFQKALSNFDSPISPINVRRLWKSAYSSLYTGFNAICNILYVVLSYKSVWDTKQNGRVWNYTPHDAEKVTRSKSLSTLENIIINCNTHLEIRSHMDHYWTIWINIQPNSFVYDADFSKGYIVIDKSQMSGRGIDGKFKLIGDIYALVHGFNSIYEELTTGNSYFDAYLNHKGWIIDYSDFGEPHNGQRPQLRKIQT